MGSQTDKLESLKQQYAEINAGYTTKQLCAQNTLDKLSTVRDTLFAITSNHTTNMAEALAAAKQLHETAKLFSEVSAPANSNDCSFTI